MNDLPAYPKRNFHKAHDWHIYHVFNDDDFRSDCLELLQELEEIDKTSHRPPETKLTYLRVDNPYVKDLFQSLAKKYAVHEFYINAFLNGLDSAHISLDLDAPPLVNISTNDEEGVISIDLLDNVTYESFLRLWPEVSKAKQALGEPKRKKGPENHDLVYAVFKAKTKGLTLPQIHKLYSDGKLPDYPHPPVKTMSFETLKKLYYTYRPK